MIDALYLERACELAARGLGNTEPNPPVGAVLVVDGRGTIGEGFHHRRGEAHAELEALLDARKRGYGEHIAGATLYVSLEPCNHHGRTPPCSEAVVAAGIARVVIGSEDPNPVTAGGGIARLRAAGVDVQVARLPAARALIEKFRIWIKERRPFVTLKMAATIDGWVAPRAGMRHWLSGEAARRYVARLRATHDAVLIGAGTLRSDDPQLSVRPPSTRLRPYRRVIACAATPPDATARIFTAQTPPVLLVPEERKAAFEGLADRALLLGVASFASDQEQPLRLDLVDAMRRLAQHEITSVLCEGGPRLATALLMSGVVDRVEWIIAPKFLGPGIDGDHALAALAGGRLGELALKLESCEQLGDDLLLHLVPKAPLLQEAAKAGFRLPAAGDPSQFTAQRQELHG